MLKLDKSIALSFLLLITSTTQADNGTTNIQSIQTQLDALVIEHKEEAKLVSLAAAVVKDGKIIAASATGERKFGNNVNVTVEDKWHIGSVSKSWTATMIARLVERGVLTWDTTIAQVFGDISTKDDSWGKVTLHQLLTHTSGAPANFPLSLMNKFDQAQGTVLEKRLMSVKKYMATTAASKPGDQWVYSNVGITIAAAMAEKVTGDEWKTLLRKEIFDPLALKSTGFGPPRGKQELDQPYGHKKIGDKLVAASEFQDNSELIWPAGGIHATLSDLLIYANDHLFGSQGKSKLLKPETYQHLHRPLLNNYAYGWTLRKSKNGDLFWHNGSNTWWYARITFIPDLNIAIAVTSNQFLGRESDYHAIKITEAITEAVAEVN